MNGLNRQGLNKSTGGSGTPEPPFSLVARAKINLTLEIKGKRADGYHELESLVMFADFGDVLHYRPAQDFSLSIRGLFAHALGQGDNLIERAWRAIRSECAQADTITARDEAPAGNRGEDHPHLNAAISSLSGAHFQLDKQIPVAAGLGGGSADAAAALRLLSKLHKEIDNVDRLLPLASSIGADVAVCLYSRTCMMTGIGDRVLALPAMPKIPAVLVNPLQPLSTAAVFKELAAEPLATNPTTSAPLPQLNNLEDVVAYASARSNDLEPPARHLIPAVGHIIDELTALPEVLVARLSGSGPSCFALCHDEAAATKVAEQVSSAYPEWWVRRTSLT